MQYSELLQLLWHADFNRIERDDRLLDVFPAEDREKGIELWEKWEESEVKILRVKVPFDMKRLTLFNIDKVELENLFQTNTVSNLSEYPPQATGEAAVEYLS